MPPLIVTATLWLPTLIVDCGLESNIMPAVSRLSSPVILILPARLMFVLPLTLMVLLPEASSTSPNASALRPPTSPVILTTLLLIAIFEIPLTVVTLPADAPSISPWASILSPELVMLIAGALSCIEMPLSVRLWLTSAMTPQPIKLTSRSFMVTACALI